MDNNQYRERREDYAQQQQHQPPPPQQQPQSHPSPPTSASPFAFAPPPLSSLNGSGSRPQLPMHNSDPTPMNGQNGAYPSSSMYARPGQLQHSQSYYPAPSATSAPMGYRSYSNEAKSSPGQPSLHRTPSMSMMQPPGQPSQASPSGPGGSSYATSSSAAYNSASSYPSNYRVPGYPVASGYASGNSPRAAPYAMPNYANGPAMGSVDMPRSLSYPSNYSQPYNNYLPSMSAPTLGGMHSLPPLARHNTTSQIGHGLAVMDLSRNGPSLGYSFQNRLPLVDRPFKCDECVQSFNRNHDLKRHKRIHLSVKPFGCDKCGKTFSRKDALRRHWLVKGCRGEDGATAPITPLFPISGPPPALSPPSPPHGLPQSSSADGFPSFSHPSAPPPLNTLPHRHTSDQSQILVTPSDPTHRGEMLAPLEEPLVVDPSGPGTRGSDGSDPAANGSYFDGVVGLKGDGTAMMDRSNSHQSQSSPYSKNLGIGGVRHHPYGRPVQGNGVGGMTSPSKRQPSPTNLGPDGKPMFAMPFAPSQYDGMLAPPQQQEAPKMEKQGSHGGEADPTTWQRWHRPSFPFPVPPGVNYNYDPSSPVAVAVDGNQQYSH